MQCSGVARLLIAEIKVKNVFVIAVTVKHGSYPS